MTRCAHERQSLNQLYHVPAGELEAAPPATFSPEHGHTESSQRVALGSHRAQVRQLAELYLRATIAADGDAIAGLFAGRPLSTDTGQPARSAEDLAEQHRLWASNSTVVEPIRAALDRGDTLFTVRNLPEFRRVSASAMQWLQPGDWIIQFNYASLGNAMPSYSSSLFTVIVVRWTAGVAKVIAVSPLAPRRA
jgi:hypothetical protein